MELGSAQLDALQEMSVVGMDRAALALSQLMKREISLKVPRVIAMDVAKLPGILGGREQMVVGVYLKILGDAQGDIMLIFNREDAIRMLDMLLCRNTAKGHLLTELEISALKEVGNILSSAYLNALGEKFKKVFIPSVPKLTMDMAGVVMDFLFDDPAREPGVAIMIDTEFSEKERNFAGHFFLLPALSSFAAMMENISA